MEPDPQDTILARMLRERAAQLPPAHPGRGALEAAVRELEGGLPAPLKESDYREEFHRLWGLAHAAPGYRKESWLDLSRDVDRGASLGRFRCWVVDARNLARGQGVPAGDLYPRDRARWAAP